MQSPTSFFRDTVLVHESAKHSMDPSDTGNWFNGKLVGSKYGVTAAALSEYRSGKDVTVVDMSKLTEAEAIEVGLKGYYRTRGLDTLPWDRVMASVIDLGFNAGSARAVKILQKLIGVNDDGAIGKNTKSAYLLWRTKRTEEQAMKAWTDARVAFYKSLNNAKYIKGWTNRANSFLPGTAWWKANA